MHDQDKKPSDGVVTGAGQPAAAEADHGPLQRNALRAMSYADGARSLSPQTDTTHGSSTDAQVQRKEKDYYLNPLWGAVGLGMSAYGKFGEGPVADMADAADEKLSPTRSVEVELGVGDGRAYEFGLDGDGDVNKVGYSQSYPFPFPDAARFNSAPFYGTLDGGVKLYTNLESQGGSSIDEANFGGQVSVALRGGLGGVKKDSEGGVFVEGGVKISAKVYAKSLGEGRHQVGSAGELPVETFWGARAIANDYGITGKKKLNSYALATYDAQAVINTRTGEVESSKVTLKANGSEAARLAADLLDQPLVRALYETNKDAIKDEADEEWTWGEELNPTVVPERQVHEEQSYADSTLVKMDDTADAYGRSNTAGNKWSGAIRTAFMDASGAFNGASRRHGSMSAGGKADFERGREMWNAAQGLKSKFDGMAPYGSWPREKLDAEGHKTLKALTRAAEVLRSCR